MEKFIFESRDENIKADFKLLFGVDLDDEKYKNYENIESRWNAVLSDVYGDRKGYSGNQYYCKFLEILMRVCVGHGSRIIRSVEKTSALIKEDENHLSELIDELIGVIEGYTVYEPDVWMNAFLSIQYYEWENKIKASLEGTELSKGAVSVSNGIVTNKSREFKVPFYEFSKREQRMFKGYEESLLAKSIEIFNTEYTRHPINDKIKKREDESKREEDASDLLGFKGYRKRIVLTFYTGKRYERWSRKKVLELENEPSFSLSDRILFYKTINGVLCRNMIDTMVLHRGDYDIEDYLYLAECLSSCMSLSWQNLIGCLFIIVSRWSEKLEGHVDDKTETIYSKMMYLFEVWISSINRINFRLECLSKGMIYLILKYEEPFCSESILQEKAEEALNILNDYLALSDKKNRSEVKLRENAKEALHILNKYFILLNERFNIKANIQKKVRKAFDIFNKYFVLLGEKIDKEEIDQKVTQHMKIKKAFGIIRNYLKLIERDNEVDDASWEEMIDAFLILKKYIMAAKEKIEIEKIEIERKKRLDNVWMSQPTEQRYFTMTVQKESNHKNPYWMYAILQRHVIDSIKNLHNICSLDELDQLDVDELVMRVYKLYTDEWFYFMKKAKQLKIPLSPPKWHKKYIKEGKYIIPPKDNNRLFCKLAVEAMEKMGQDEVSVGEVWKMKLKQNWKEQYPGHELPDRVLNNILEHYAKWISKMEKRYNKQRMMLHSQPCKSLFTEKTEKNN